MKTLFNVMVVISIIMLIYYLSKREKLMDTGEHNGETKPPILVDNDNVQEITVAGRD